jgi:tRNA-Thr(GGU) m(6)t(6)A37 methyltransferase TsaA
MLIISSASVIKEVVNMVNELPEMTLKAIGIVRNEIKQLGMDYREIVSDIVIDSRLTEALDNLDEFSHIIVFYWMQSGVAKEVPTKVHPMGKQELPPVGLFATRSPNRPNPIAKATVRLLQRQGNILKVKGLSAVNGSPVIDITPYLHGTDSGTNSKAPSWAPARQPI